MKTYEIKELKNQNNHNYTHIIFATSYKDPLEDLIKIEKELAGNTGKILFDFLLTNGISSNRFVEAKIENGEIDITSFKIINAIDDNLNDIILNFYKNNQHLLDNSVLNKAQKFLLKYKYL